jgi:hypothetical protein
VPVTFVTEAGVVIVGDESATRLRAALAADEGWRSSAAHLIASAIDEALRTGEALVPEYHERLTIVEVLGRMGDPLPADLQALRDALSDFSSLGHGFGPTDPPASG